jgi:hypothetical protein
MLLLLLVLLRAYYGSVYGDVIGRYTGPTQWTAVPPALPGSRSTLNLPPGRRRNLSMVIEVFEVQMTPIVFSRGTYDLP